MSHAGLKLNVIEIYVIEIEMIALINSGYEKYSWKIQKLQ